MPLSTQEQQTLDRIQVLSWNNPSKPEFPAENPKFPATPTYQISVPGFSNIWLKDESHNPTGTHKDRLAREVVVSYKDFLLAKKEGLYDHALPQMSLLSSGSAAFAIQYALRKYYLPPLKILLDADIDKGIVDQLQRLGCEVYYTSLAEKLLTPEDILQLTDNPQGIDITSSEALDATTRFYDWLSFEIINENPERCFVPFGTGNLYENILNISKKEIANHSGGHDPRFRGDMKTIRRCNFMGATTSNPDSFADKLYSPHLPFVHYSEEWLKFYKYAGFCGQLSNVLEVDELHITHAVDILQEQGVQIEGSSVAGLGLLLQMGDALPADAKILIVSTGTTKRDLE